jgi:MmyB-like transcription regulator ligand binding domain
VSWPVNAARLTFLDPAAEFYPDWVAVADQNAATLRAEVGRNRNPYDKALSDLIGELSTRGDIFRQRWGRHDVRRHRDGAKRLNHPLVGQLTFTYETVISPPTRACTSSCAVPHPAARTRMHSACWPAGMPPATQK